MIILITQTRTIVSNDSIFYSTLSNYDPQFHKASLINNQESTIDYIYIYIIKNITQFQFTFHYSSVLVFSNIAVRVIDRVILF